MTSTANSVGIGPLADEPKLSQHPIRGQGEPVAWRYRVANDQRWVLSEVEPDPTLQWPIVQPLYAHPPTSYEGEGLREAIEPLRRAVDMADESNEGRPEGPRRSVKDFILDSELRSILQALQSASGK